MINNNKKGNFNLLIKKTKQHMSTTINSFDKFTKKFVLHVIINNKSKN